MKYLLLILMTTSLMASIHDIRTNSFWGMTVLEAGDTLIIHPNHKLAKTKLPSNIRVVFCETMQCRKDEVKRLKKLYKTNGISHHIVQ